MYAPAISVSRAFSLMNSGQVIDRNASLIPRFDSSRRYPESVMLYDAICTVAFTRSLP